MAITSGDRYSALESFTINTREIHQHGNQQRDKEPWYAVGERVRLRPSGESRGHHLSGQVSHDDRGNIVGLGDMEVQMRQAYTNIQKVLAHYGATMDNIVDEILFVTDMDTAFAAAVKCRQDIFSGTPVVASTIVQIQRLAFSDLMIEIKCVTKV
jgi:2-iminobutanoate/2-iminopropanoate deaminase